VVSEDDLNGKKLISTKIKGLHNLLPSIFYHVCEANAVALLKKRVKFSQKRL